MAYRIMSNRVAGSAVLLFTGAGNTTVVVAGNNSASNLTANSVEVIAGADIRRLSWGAGANSTATGVITIYRGANVVMTLSGTGEKGLVGLVQNLDPAANLVVNLPDANSTLIVELGKQYVTMSYQGY